MQDLKIDFTVTNKILDSPYTKLLFNLLGKYSNKLFIVGGAIRDSFLFGYNSNYDVDFVVNEQIKDINKYINLHLQEKQFNNIKIDNTLLNYGVIRLNIEDKIYDITMFRNDFYKYGSRYPIVKYTNSIIEDSKRRDFTVNAIYLNKNNELFDPTDNGIEDLKNKRIRFILDSRKDDNINSGILRRIVEDPLRIVRYIRIYLKFFPDFTYNIGLNKDIYLLDLCANFLQKIIAYDKKTINILLDNIKLLKLINENKLKSEINKIFIE